MTTQTAKVCNRNCLGVAMLTSVVLAACGQLQAALDFGPNHARQGAKAIAELVVLPRHDNTNTPARALSAEMLDTLADLEELAPSFTDGCTISRRVYTRIVSEREFSHLVIFIRTTNGIVTLSGIVDSDTVRMTVVELARHVAGVRQVDDQLVVDGKLS